MPLKKNILSSLIVLLGILSILPALLHADDTQLQASMANGGKGMITLAAKPLQTMTEIPFLITLQDSANRPIEGARLDVDLTMPAMSMPANRPVADWNGNGYVGTAVFTMAGAWQVNVKVSHPELGTENLVFDIDMVLMK